MKENVAKKAEVKKTAVKNKKPNIFKRIGRKFKEVFAEIKKVSWPSFGKVVKQTSIVLGIVLLFAIVITVFDFGLGQLLSLLTSIGG